MITDKQSNQSMKCEFCNGTGKLHPKAEGWDYIPCPECNGTGIADCCNGMQVCQVVDNNWLDNPAEADSFGRKK